MGTAANAPQDDAGGVREAQAPGGAQDPQERRRRACVRRRRADGL